MKSSGGGGRQLTIRIQPPLAATCTGVVMVACTGDAMAMVRKVKAVEAWQLSVRRR